MSGAEKLDTIIGIADQLGVERVAQEAKDLRERLSEGRFFVACVGQFKRGKSSLLNALVGRAVLPVGVIPVTAVITVLRFGDHLQARVRFATGDWREIEPNTLGEFVSETENPENAKGVTAVEVFVPSELLRHGMCLVDTPGLGSVFAGNTAATREFVPQIDAALVVLGADPPLSGAELELIEETVKQIDRLVLVMNKADRLTDDERAEGRAFAEKVLRERLRRDVPAVLEVSAKERTSIGVRRDWGRLETTLRALADERTDVVRQAEARAVPRLRGALLREIDEREGALRRPQEQSARRIEALRQSIGHAERTLGELDYLFKAVQDNLGRAYDREAEKFLREVTPTVTRDLEHRIDADADADAKHLPTLAMEGAQALARQAVESWRATMEPVAEKLYSEAVARFAEIANDFLRRVADPKDPALAALPESFEPKLRFRTRPHFYFTDMLTLASPKLGTRLAGITKAMRVAAVKMNATEYLVRLLATNSSRVANDFSGQVLESRRLVQAELRDHLQAVVSSAETALRRADEQRALGYEAVKQEWTRYEGFRARLGVHAARGTSADD